MNMGEFGYGSAIQRRKLSKMLINAKQISTDVSAITPVWKDPTIINSIKAYTPYVTELKHVDAPEVTHRWETNSADNFSKFVTESNAASRFSAQKGSYAESTATCKLMSYVMNIGMIANKNVGQPGSPYSLVKEEQQLAMKAMNKGIERAVITGDPTGGVTDGSATDAYGFEGLGTSITTNVDEPGTAEAITLDKLDASIDAIVDYGIPENELLIVTDQFTKTKIASLFYNTYNTPMDKKEVNAGFKIKSYREAPIFNSTYMPTTTGERQLYITHKETTVLADFWKTSQLDLGRTELSDDSIMFYMGTLAVKDEPANAAIKKIV